MSFILGPGNVPKGRAVFSFNWDLEMYQKEKPQSVLIGTWKIYQKEKLQSVLIGTWKFYQKVKLQSVLIGTWKLLPKGCTFGRFHSSYLLLSHSRCKRD